jgi:hemerythrin HHE cation binding domain-containing protein
VDVSPSKTNKEFCMSVIESLKTYLSIDPRSDILAALREDHEQIKKLTSAMSEEKTAARRRALFEELKPLLTAHSRVEEQVVYSAMINVRDSKDSHDLGNEGFVEHSLVDVLLERLGKTDLAGTDAWKAHATVLKEMLEHHIKEEEDEFFKELGEHFSDEQLETMAIEFESRKAKLLGTQESASDQRRR